MVISRCKRKVPVFRPLLIVRKTFPEALSADSPSYPVGQSLHQVPIPKPADLAREMRLPWWAHIPSKTHAHTSR